MKSICSARNATIFFVALFIQTLNAQDYTIKIEVDTEKINHDNIYEPGIITLDDDSLSATGPDIKRFTTYIKKESDIKWTGIANTKGHQVEVIDVKRKWALFDLYLFSKDLLEESADMQDTDVTATSNDLFGRYKYCIIIKVTKDGLEQTYEIDPKLRAKARIGST